MLQSKSSFLDNNSFDKFIKTGGKPATFIKLQSEPVFILTLTRLNVDIACFENSLDPDQLASQKPADQNQHFFSNLLVFGKLIT